MILCSYTCVAFYDYMIMITENTVTNRDEKYKSHVHRTVSYNLSKNNCKDWDSIVSVGKLFQSQIDLGKS